MKTMIIEKRTVDGQYNLNSDQMIIDHEKHGRLLLIDGFGGVGTLDGGAYRWKHGLAVKLLPGDTFSTLEEPWNGHTSTFSSAIAGYDDSRPIINWDGFVIEKIANSVL